MLLILREKAKNCGVNRLLTGRKWLQGGEEEEASTDPLQWLAGSAPSPTLKADFVIWAGLEPSWGPGPSPVPRICNL